MAGAQVWGGAKRGIDDDSVNSVHLESIQARILRTAITGANHIGDTAFLSLGDERVEVDFSGITAAAATSGTDGLATALTSANSAIWDTDFDAAAPEVYLAELTIRRQNQQFEIASGRALGFLLLTGVGAPAT